MVWKEEVAECDVRIVELIREKVELQNRLTKAEVDMKLEEAKTKGAHRLVNLLEKHVRNNGEVLTKARLYDEAMAKIDSITALKLIHISMDYSTRMETILAKMRAFFTAQNHFFHGSPIPLEKVVDLTEFLDLPLADMLQNLHTPTMLRKNPELLESRE